MQHECPVYNKNASNCVQNEHFGASLYTPVNTEHIVRGIYRPAVILILSGPAKSCIPLHRVWLIYVLSVISLR